MNTLTKQELADWIAALRSGKFKQGKYVLHNINTNTFCCLGVYAETNNLFSGIRNNDKFIIDSSGVGNTATLGKDHGARVNNLAEVFPSLQSYLIKMNDDLGKSFNEIADYLETLMEKAQ